MAAIRPFCALRYNPDRVEDLSRVIAPPYDVIPKDMQNALYRSHPSNIVRLILNKITSRDNDTNNRCTRSKKLFDLWLKKNILVRDKKESLYIYSQKYNTLTRKVEQIGFIGLMGLELAESKNKILTARENGVGNGKVTSFPAFPHNCTTEVAAGKVAETFKKIAEEHGPQSVGFLGSPYGTNEENYLYQKFFRQGLGSNNIDHKSYQFSQVLDSRERISLCLP